jgi:hypothetical protein
MSLVRIRSLDFIEQHRIRTSDPSSGNQIKNSAFSNKHGPSWARYHPRENSTSSYLCSCTNPLSSCTRTKNPSTATHPLPVAIGRYCLLLKSGFHRPFDLREGRQSWRRPNGTQSATSNCNAHDR